MTLLLASFAPFIICVSFTLINVETLHALTRAIVDVFTSVTGKVLSQPRLPYNLETSKEYGIVPNNFIDSSNLQLTCVVLYL